MKHYYILSLKHSPVQGMALWWGPEGCGYTTRLHQAGIYSHDEISAHSTRFNDGKDSVAIEVDVVLAMSHQVVDMASARNQLYRQNSDWQKDALEGRR